MIFQRLKHVMGDSRKYLYPTTSLQRIFAYKQGIVRPRTSFDLTKSQSGQTKFWLQIRMAYQ